MEKITPNLWFDNEAVEAAEFYADTFAGSKIKSTVTLRDTPSGDTDIVTAELCGREFTLISAGPLFKFTPAVSFMVQYEGKDEVDAAWNRLIAGGTALMELGEYPFSARYGWVQDKYGLSWQLMHAGERAIKQKIIPMFMFVGAQCGRAEEAMRFWVSVFRDASVGNIMRYGPGEEPEREGTVKYARFALEDREFAALDSALAHKFGFNEAISFIVHCRDQAEIDYYWERLSAAPEAEQCGWLKDRFGVSWQIVPLAMDEMLADADEAKVARVTQAFLPMKKLDIAALTRAYEAAEL